MSAPDGPAEWVGCALAALMIVAELVAIVVMIADGRRLADFSRRLRAGTPSPCSLSLPGPKRADSSGPITERNDDGR